MRQEQDEKDQQSQDQEKPVKIAEKATQLEYPLLLGRDISVRHWK
jgi:hypothetical protein